MNVYKSAENNIQPGRDITFARHFCFSVDNVDATLDRLKEYGVDLIAGPRSRGDGASQMYIYHPSGHMVELVPEPWEWE